MYKYKFIYINMGFLTLFLFFECILRFAVPYLAGENLFESVMFLP